MSHNMRFFQSNFLLGFTATSLAIGLTGCGSSSDDTSNDGYVKFYNGSENAPAIHLIVDEDLETSEDDEIEVTFGGVAYGHALGNSQLENNDYFYELAWQDDDSTSRDELEVIYQGDVKVIDDTIHMISMKGDISAPEVLEFDIPIIDEDDDDTYERFNFRFLNLHPNNESFDVYISEDDETFNEAELLSSVAPEVLTDNIKRDQGSYIFYITASGSDEVLYQSNNIDFFYTSQYVMVVRKNDGAGTSPYIIDQLTNSSTYTHIDSDAEAQFNVYNALITHELQPIYTGRFDLHIGAVDDTPEVNNLDFGTSSDTIPMASGDYAVTIMDNATQQPLMTNHLLTLPENSNKTVFFYADIVDVDEDGDGNVDEDGDGIVDKQEYHVHSKVVSNSVSESIYHHNLALVNFVDSDDFNSVTYYFVRSDETIDTAYYKRTLGFIEDKTLTLSNNTYEVYAVAQDNGSEIILDSLTLTLDESFDDAFIVVEKEATSATGYKITLFDQSAL